MGTHKGSIMAFSLSIYPWVYKAQYGRTVGQGLRQKPHQTPAQEAWLRGLQDLLTQRNSFPELPGQLHRGTAWAVSRASRPTPADGASSCFRPDRNTARMKRSMEGLLVPGYPENLFVAAPRGHRQERRGFRPSSTSWGLFANGAAVTFVPSAAPSPPSARPVDQPLGGHDQHPVSAYFRTGPPRPSPPTASGPPQGTG
jgi:branched-chain amino acid aminotransferase